MTSATVLLSHDAMVVLERNDMLAAEMAERFLYNTASTDIYEARQDERIGSRTVSVGGLHAARPAKRPID